MTLYDLYIYKTPTSVPSCKGNEGEGEEVGKGPLTALKLLVFIYETDCL